MRRALCLAAACLALGCSHDLAKLRSGLSKTTIRDAGGGKGTAHFPDAGQAGQDGGAEAGTDSGTGAGRCEPCPELPDAGPDIALRSCCLGVTGDQCGLTSGLGMLCLARNVPGQPNSACPGARFAGNMIEGCCRADGRCGVSATSLELGCVARDEVLPVLGIARGEAVACSYTCNADSDCASAPGFVCAEDPSDPSQTRHICVKSCQRDQNCAKTEVCGLRNDHANDRVLAFCQAPIGSGLFGDTCGLPTDCGHGICLMYKSGDKPSACGQLCQTDNDCPTDVHCVTVGIRRPKSTGMQNFHVCQP